MSYYKWSTKTWKNTRESFALLKTYYHFVIVKGAATHIYGLRKAFIWFDATILCLIVGDGGLQLLGKKTYVHSIIRRESPQAFK